MVDTLQPREYFPISRLLPDPSDSNTYYLRAVIRNATSGATIDTVDLLTQGNRIYAEAWQAPSDPSGRGLFITITTSVYTDSGYTTKSDVYGEETDTFVVFDRFNSLQLLATQISAIVGSGAEEIDYKKIKKMIDDAFQNVSARLKVLESKETPKPLDLSPVLASLSKISSAVASIKIPEFEKADLAPFLEKFTSETNRVLEAIAAIVIPEPEKMPDILSPINERFDEVETKRGEDMEQLQTLLKELAPKIEVLQQFTDAARLFARFSDKEKPEEKMPEKKSEPKEVSEINRFGKLVKRKI